MSAPIPRTSLSSRADGWSVAGELSFATVPPLLADSGPALERTQGALRVDLGAVERVDSAGLALLIEWLRLARAAGRELRYIGVSDRVRSIIRVNGLSEALGLGADDR